MYTSLHPASIAFFAYKYIPFPIFIHKCTNGMSLYVHFNLDFAWVYLD